MTAAPIASRRLFMVVTLALALVTLAVYWPVSRNDFIHYDDDEYIVGNRHVNTGLTWANVAWAFEHKHAGNWHPLTWISHMADCQLFGLNAGRQHLVNVAFHVANTLLLFFFLIRATGAFWRSAFVAAFFAWHPLRVESVAWAAERKDVLSAFFWMLTLIAYARYARRRSRVEARESRADAPALDSRLSALDYGLALFFFACGLLSKPMVVTLPFVLLLLDFWPLKRLQSIQSALRLTLEKLPFFALTLAGCAVTVYVQRSSGAFWSLANLPLRDRIANALAAYLGYISKTFWPVHLALIYPHPHHWPTALTLSSALLLAFWTIFVLWRARQQPYLVAGWFWFLGTLVPVIGLVQVGVQSMADRYTYLPGIGLLIAVVWSADALCLRPVTKKLLAAVAEVALAGCLVLTSIQIGYWRNGLTIFTHAVEATSGNYAAEVCLGEQLEDAGKPFQALALYTDAVRLEPTYPLAQYNLGMSLLALGKPDEARAHLQTAAQLMPGNPDLQYDYGLLLRQQGDLAGAVDRFRAALARRPDFPAALNELAGICATANEPQLRSGPEALRLAHYACDLTSNREPAYLVTLATACAESGQFTNAIAAAQKARELALAGGQTNIATQTDDLLKRFQAGQPIRETN